MLSKEEISQIFNERPRKLYRKKGKYLFRPAREGETILTIVSGRLETFIKATKNDVIMRNIEIGSSAETYIISESMFNSRYEVVQEYTEKNVMPVRHYIDQQEWVEVVAKGRCEALEYRGDRITFMAPWNVEMECFEGDYLARPVPGAVDDIYRIERDTFFLTYFKESE